MEDFIRFDYNGIVDNKLKFKKKGCTSIVSSDGKRSYEFLIESSEQGTWYGCRGAILEGNPKEEIQNFTSEWEDKLKSEVCSVLNGTFTGIDFSGRIISAVKVDDRTIWPVKIYLGDNEDIKSIAARATKLIANVYEIHICGGYTQPSKKSTADKHIVTRYTQETFDGIISRLEAKNGKAVRIFNDFIKTAEKRGYIIRDKRYEKCWRITRFKNVEIAFLFKCLSERMGLIEKGAKAKIPWFYFTPVFRSRYDRSLDNIKQSYNGKSTDDYQSSIDKILNDWNIN